jgi:hypothetical protein
MLEVMCPRLGIDRVAAAVRNKGGGGGLAFASVRADISLSRENAFKVTKEM